MSTWEAHGAAGSTLLGWSSFGEMVWNKFDESGDHAVPETEALAKSAWPLKYHSLPKSNNDFILTTAKISDQNSQELPNSCCSGLDSREELFGDLNTQQAVLPYKEISPVCLEEVPWNEFTRSPNSINQSDCSSLRSGFDGGSREVNKESKFESSNYEVKGTKGLCKVDSVYQGSDGDIGNGSCDFLLSDMCPPGGGDLEFLGDMHEEGKGGNLLEYGWGNANNLEDVGRLFLNSDPLLPQDFNDSSEEILWESSSPVMGSIHQPIRRQMSSELRALKRDFKRGETKMEFVPCKAPSTPMNVETDIERKEQSVPGHGKLPSASNLPKSTWSSQVEFCTGQSINDKEVKPPGAFEGFLLGSKDVEDDGNSAPKEVEKASKTKRHAARRKRLEERTKKQRSEHKSALKSYNYPQANNSQLPYIPSKTQSTSSSVQDFSSPSTPVSHITQRPVIESPSSRHLPQPVPYVHAGFGFPAHHHMPIIISGLSTVPQQMQQDQPFFVGYGLALEGASKPQQFRNPNETSPHTPIRSSTMTPQEKIEKLCQRPKKQAHLDFEQQQQQHLQLFNQRLRIEQKQVQKQHQHQTQAGLKGLQEVVSGAIQLEDSQAGEPLVWNVGRVTKAESTTEEGNDLLAATVLQQLLCIASEMDPRTSLCLRDGFLRLARSAMQRHALGDVSGCSGSISEPHKGNCGHESSSTSDQSSSSRRILTVKDIVETETNPIDRFIAHLLFHKGYPPLSRPLYMNTNSCVTIVENPEVALPHQIPWTWQTALPSHKESPEAGPSTVNSGPVVIQGDLDVDACASSNSHLRLSHTSTGVPTSIACNLLGGNSPAQPKNISLGLKESHLGGSQEVSPDFYNVSDSKCMNTLIRRKTLCNHNESAIVPVSEDCLAKYRQFDHSITEKKLSSSDLASGELFLADEIESLTSAAIIGSKHHHLVRRGGTSSDSHLRYTIKDEAGMREDSIPSGTVLSMSVESLDEVMEPKVEMKDNLKG